MFDFTNFRGADTRGAQYLDLPPTAITNNLIRPDGHIAGLDLTSGAFLTVRDYDGNPTSDPTTGPLAIVVEEHLTMDASGTLRLVFDEDPWDSVISFETGIPIRLGGTLELAFAADVDVATQGGRTLDLFDWTGFSPAGQFQVASSFDWDLTQLYNTGQVTFLGVSVLPDYNGNGLVEQGDLDLVLLNWGTELSDPAGVGWLQAVPVGVADQAELDGVLLQWGDRFAGVGAVANPAWLDATALKQYEIVPVPAGEPDAANVALVGGTVCAAAGHPETANLIRDLGFRVETTDLSEFAKADGCVTCLSLLIEDD